MIEIRPVETSQDWSHFLSVPWTVYRNDPAWVPPLKIAIKEALDVNKNPFWKHAFMRAFVAMDDSKPVGRIVGIYDEAHNKLHDEQVAYFGFYECVDNGAISQKLFDRVKAWAKGRGASEIRGPMNPSTNYECGMLIEGYDTDPYVMMLHNPPYYVSQLENLGFKKAADMYAYEIYRDTQFSDRVWARSERVRQKNDILIRSFDPSRFNQEVSMMKEIYNDILDRNWGFDPYTDEEWAAMAAEMKLIYDPQLILIAEVRGKPAGFALALPDVNQVFKKVESGELLPTGLVELLWNLKGPGRKKTINRGRILILGVKKDFESLGLGPLFYGEYYKRMTEMGWEKCECSFVYEDNHSMNKALKFMNAKKTKTYRIYSDQIQ